MSPFWPPGSRKIESVSKAIFWEKFSLCSLGWLEFVILPVSASPVLELQMYTTTPGLKKFIFKEVMWELDTAFFFLPLVITLSGCEEAEKYLLHYRFEVQDWNTSLVRLW
jgi:hypothetical protein